MRAGCAEATLFRRVVSPVVTGPAAGRSPMSEGRPVVQPRPRLLKKSGAVQPRRWSPVVSDAPSPSVLSDLSIASHPSVFPQVGEAALHDVIDVGPDLTFATVADFRRRIIDLVALHEVRVIVDLRATERLDAMGLGALVAARRRLRASGG